MLGEKIVKTARSWIGTKYHHQARLKKNKKSLGGVDCIGLIVGVAKELSLKSKCNKLIDQFDYTTYSAYPDGETITQPLDTHLLQVDLEQMQAGDVLLFKYFRRPQHVAFYTGDSSNSIIHCTSGIGSVAEEPLDDYWIERLLHVYRFTNV